MAEERLALGQEPVEDIERLADEIASERYRNIGTLFPQRRSPPPFLLWQPQETDLPARPLVELWRWWSNLPSTGGLPDAGSLDADLDRASTDSITVVECTADRQNFVCRRRIASNGSLEPGGLEGPFAAAVYRAVLLRREPLYVTHPAAEELLGQAETLILPLAGLGDEPGRLVVGSVAGTPYRLLADAVMDGVLLFDATGRIRFGNDVVAGMLGRTGRDLPGRPITDLLRAPFLDGWRSLGGTLVTTVREAVLQRADGSELPVGVSIGELRPPAGGRLHVAVLRDVSAYKAAEEHYRALALTDPLTGLANRVLFRDRIGQAMARARRARQGLALLLIDLDSFKAVNDRFGHLSGDQALLEFARRLRSLTREADILARLGGDEFALVQTDLEQTGGVQALADRLVAAQAEPVLLGAQPVPLHASIGIAVYPEDGESLRSLTEHADQALYRAKARGGRCWVRFGDDTD